MEKKDINDFNQELGQVGLVAKSWEKGDFKRIYINIEKFGNTFFENYQIDWVGKVFIWWNSEKSQIGISCKDLWEFGDSKKNYKIVKDLISFICERSDLGAKDKFDEYFEGLKD